MSKTYDSKCLELAKHFYPDATDAQLHTLACDIQTLVEDASGEMDREPRDSDIDGEALRGGEYASALAAEQARVQRELK
jgi:hypothetical protein